MKKFIITEEEKNRILNLHENMKETILTSSKHKLNENVGSPILALLRGFKTSIQSSGLLMSKLDDMARTFRSAAKYPGQVQSGDDLLKLFLSGGLSNMSATDDMATVLLGIFKTTDDPQIIKALAKEMIDGSIDLRNGILNGTINPIVVFGTKQGDELADYARRAYGGNMNPFGQTGYNQGGGFNYGNQLGGSWNSNVVPYYGVIAELKPGYAVAKLRGLFPNNSRVKKYLDGAEDEINSFIPTSKEDAQQIVEQNRLTIEAMLKKRNVPQRLWDAFIDQLITGWPLKAALGFFSLLGIVKLSRYILSATGNNGWSPMVEFGKLFGFEIPVEIARERLCADGNQWACNAKSDGGSGEGALDN